MWLYQIFGIESREIPNTILDLIKQYMNEESVPKCDLSCELIRRYLQRMKQTTYNTNITKIRKLITGIGPLPPTNSELEKIQSYIDLINIIQADNLILASSNIKIEKAHYFPHIFRLIIINIYLHDLARVKSILECIHIQGKKTCDNNDKKLKILCEKTNGRLIFYDYRSFI
jgi:hypothetical protein